MIVPILPELKDQRDREEVRKALLNLARQMENELRALESRIYKLENP